MQLFQGALQVLQILQAQLVGDDLEVSYWVNIALHVGYIVVVESSYNISPICIT